MTPNSFRIDAFLASALGAAWLVACASGSPTRANEPPTSTPRAVEPTSSGQEVPNGSASPVASDAAADTSDTSAREPERSHEAGPRLDPFESAILDAHRRVRAGVSPSPSVPLPPVEWDESLASLARDWASRCPDGHRPDNDYGENLYWSGGEPIDAAAVVASWASESRYYDYRTERCVRNGRASWAACGHYTQLVWRDTVRIGCAVRTGCPGELENVVVCNYDPPGNVNASGGRIPHPY